MDSPQVILIVMNGKMPPAIISLLTVAIAVVLVLPISPVEDEGDNEGVPPPDIWYSDPPPPYTWFSADENEDNWPYLSWLHVEDNRIVNENGDTIILRGVNIEGLWRFYYHGELRKEVFITLSENWNVNAIRVPIYPKYWQNHPDILSNFYDHVIRICHKYGMYVILEWHGVGNPITGQTADIEWGNDARKEIAENAWHVMAERYKDNSWVIYDIFNEPVWISWDEWKPVAENLIDIVRSHNPRALILVPGVKCGGDLRGIATNPINRDNIIYATHIYPNTSGIIFRNENKELMRQDLETYAGFVAENYPLIVSEWGYDSENQFPYILAIQGTRQNYADTLVEWMNVKKLSWTAWIWSATWAATMLSDWDYTPNEFGQLAKDLLENAP